MATKKSTGTMWKIACEGHPVAYVAADNWEQATLEAARYWGVPWRRIAARCELVEKSIYVRNICPKCGRMFNREGVLCTVCRESERSYREERERSAKAAAAKEIRRFYREEREKASAAESN